MIVPNLHPPHYVYDEVSLVTIETFPIFCAWIAQERQCAECFFAVDQIDVSFFEVMTGAGKSVAKFRKAAAGRIMMVDLYTASAVAQTFCAINNDNYVKLLERFRFAPDKLCNFIFGIINKMKAA